MIDEAGLFIYDCRHMNREILGLSEKRETIEEQFENPETMVLDGQPVEVFDIWPEEPKHETPVVFGCGWETSPEVYRASILAMAKDGFRVIAAKAPHGMDIRSESVLSGRERDMSEYPKAELRKLAAVLEAMHAKGIKEADAVGHSESAIFLTMAATMFEDKFRNLTLVNPAGVVENSTVGKVARGFAKNAAFEPAIVKQVILSIKKRQDPDFDPKKVDLTQKNQGDFGLLQYIRTTASNPWEAIRSIFALSTADIRGMLRDLKAKGKNISVIHSVDDKGFPMTGVQRSLSTKEVTGFYSLPGSHNAIFTNSDVYTKAIVHSLNAMEKKGNAAK